MKLDGLSSSSGRRNPTGCRDSHMYHHSLLKCVFSYKQFSCSTGEFFCAENLLEIFCSTSAVLFLLAQHHPHLQPSTPNLSYVTPSQGGSWPRTWVALLSNSVTLPASPLQHHPSRIAPAASTFRITSAASPFQRHPSSVTPAVSPQQQPSVHRERMSVCADRGLACLAWSGSRHGCSGFQFSIKRMTRTGIGHEKKQKKGRKGEMGWRKGMKCFGLFQTQGEFWVRRA